MASTDKQKQSLYFPRDMLGEIMNEAVRLDRSLSWMVQQAWRIARAEVCKLPSIEHALASPASDRESQPAIAHEARRDPERSRANDLDSDREPSVQVREFLRGKFENA
jgi:uncharacterized small protein (TIGR04563 family)